MEIILTRLLNKIEKTDYCWLWTGASNTKGYGRFKIKGKLYSPHRLMYEIYRGPIPTIYEVCHKCDNPKCVNPDHLFLGTRSDNMKDAYQKGRLFCFVGNCKKVKGEEVGTSKLKDADIKVIRILDTFMKRCEIAKLYSVHQSQITRCLNKLTFKHIL